MEALEERVSDLEIMVMRVLYIQQKTEIEMQKLQREMKEFKEAIQKDTENLKKEMREFKEAIQKDTENLKGELKEFKDEMKEFKDEMKEFKDEMKEFKDEMRREVRRMNKQWGELANKMGTIVEDIVFPAARPVIKKYFNCDPEILMMNVRRKKGDRREEFDVIGVCDDKVFLIEVKSTLKAEHTGYMKRKMSSFKEFFSEYKDREIVPILASLKIEREVINRLTRERIYGMAYREWEYMDILNFDEIKGNAE